MKDLIVKDNKLIRAKYSLSLYQTRFIAHMASRINRDDTDFFTYTIRLNELLELLNIERGHWKRLDKTLTELIGKIIVIEGCNLKNTNSLYFLKKKLNNFLTTPYFP